MILRDCWLLFLDIETLCIAVSKIKIADMVMVFLIKMLARSVCWSSDYHMTVPSANSWVLNWWLNVCIFKYVDSNVKWQLYWYWMLFYLHAVKGNNIFISVLKIYVKGTPHIWQACVLITYWLAILNQLFAELPGQRTGHPNFFI